jgi:hypothetical protein
MKILVTKKSQYGLERFFPQNDVGRIFTNFMGRETLSREHLEALQTVGFEIEYINPPN